MKLPCNDMWENTGYWTGQTVNSQNVGLRWQLQNFGSCQISLILV